MNRERFEKQLAFILEADKEKNILRQTHLTGHGRRENDAEHAWHMAMMIYLLKEYSNQEIDVAKAMMMALIHDIVEIDAGDTYAYDTKGLESQKEREARAARKEQEAAFWAQAEVGQEYTGAVKSLTSYGAFVDLGGVDGMVHISEMSWSRIKHPSEVMKHPNPAKFHQLHLGLIVQQCF